MIELSRHIEILLLENDCVIIPDFGGFVTHYTPAGRSERENLFLPPCRTLGFNPLLRINDGLLVQSVMSVNDLSFSDASRLIEEEVGKMHAALRDTGKVDFGKIGELRYGITGQYEFVPNESDLTSPVLYGLDAFYMEELTPEVRKKPVYKEKTVITHPASSSYTIHINRTLVRSIAASVAAIFILLLFSPSVENTYIPEENYATLLPSSVLSQLNDYSLLFSPLVLSKEKEEKQEENIVVQESEDIQQNVKPVAVKEVVVSRPTEASGGQPETTVRSQSSVSATASRRYHLIISSLVYIKDAEAQVETLKKQGYEGASVITGDGKVRVSLCSFDDRQEAYRQLSLYREKQGFESAWLLIR